MAPTCVIRQDPPGEKFLDESIISLLHNRFDAVEEEHEEETSVASETFPEVVASTEPYEEQPLPSNSSALPIAQGRSISKFDPTTLQQHLVENDDPIDESSRRSDLVFNMNEIAVDEEIDDDLEINVDELAADEEIDDDLEINVHELAADEEIDLEININELAADEEIAICDPFDIQPIQGPLLDSSVVSQPMRDDQFHSNENDVFSEEIEVVKSVDDPNVLNDQDVLLKKDLSVMNPEIYGASPISEPTSRLLLDPSVQPQNKDDSFPSSETNDSGIALNALDVQLSPTVICLPDTLVDSSVLSLTKGDEPIENSSGRSEASSDEIAWVAPFDYPNINLETSGNFENVIDSCANGIEEDTIFEEAACVVPIDDYVFANNQDFSFIENGSTSLDRSVIQPRPTSLDPSVLSHYVNHEASRDPSIINARNIPLNVSDEDSSKLYPSMIQSPQSMFDRSVLSHQNYDSEVFHQIINDDDDSPSNYNSNDDDAHNFNGSAENVAMQSSMRSSASDLSGSGRCSGSFRASEYFERTIVEEYNLRIEEEQRDCSLVSMPVVAAVYDDTTTIIVRPPPNAVANPEHNTVNAVVSSRQLGRQLDPQQAPSPPPRKTTLTVSQLKKLRQEYGLPTGVVLEMGEFQRIACTFFVCDTNEVEEDCIKECAQLADACQSQAIFCFGTYQQEILYPPAKQANGRVPRAGHVLAHCAAAVRNSGRFRTTKETTRKLMEIASRIPSFDRWPSEKVAVTIFTDRTFYSDQDDDKEFVGVIRSLVKLGARVIIRLNTSQREVVSYYKYLKQTFSALTIIYSFEYQKRLVHHFNPWLNYGAPLHRARELGFYFHRTVEFLGKRILNRDHVREFLVVFHGKKAMVLAPDIHSEWSDFYQFLKKINQKEGKHRLSIDSKNKNRRDCWIDLKHFERLFKNENEEPRRSSMPREQQSSYSQFLRVEI